MLLNKIIFYVLVIATYCRAEDSVTQNSNSPEQATAYAYCQDLASLQDIVGPIPTAIKQAINYLKAQHNFDQTTQPIKKGGTTLLLYGPPGTGKTTLAQVIAHESKSTFFMIEVQHLFNGYLGTASNYISSVFNEARELQKPAVIFFDEIDSLCNREFRRGTNCELSNAFATLLLEIQKCNQGKHRYIYFIAATNCYGYLDPALKNRFSKQVEIGLPDQEQRFLILEQLFKIHSFQVLYTNKKIHGTDKLLKYLAKETKDFSARELVHYIETILDNSEGQYIHESIFRETLKKVKDIKNKETHFENRHPESWHKWVHAGLETGNFIMNAVIFSRNFKK